MHLHGYADIRGFRVKLPQQYQGRNSIETCESIDLPDGSIGWQSIDDLAELFPSKFTDKNPLNIPGAIYGAETDTCETGPHEAPNNVLLDRNGQEFVFRQASTAEEFRDLVSAARSECFEGYGSDGDSHWRLSTIREWWQTRDDMLREEIRELACNAESVLRWKRALNGEAEGYLRVYAFFVENGRVPDDGDVLPEINSRTK